MGLHGLAIRNRLAPHFQWLATVSHSVQMTRKFLLSRGSPVRIGPGAPLNLRKSISWQTNLCSNSPSKRIFGNIWEHLLLKKRYGLSLGDHAGVSVNLERRRHARMPELGLSNLQRCSLNMQESAVSVSQTMPIDSWESCTLTGRLQTSLAQVVGRQGAAVSGRKNQPFR